MSELVTAINRLAAAIETYNQTNSIVQMIDKVPGMDKFVGRFFEVKLKESHPEFASFGMDEIGRIVPEEDPAPLLAGQLTKELVGQPYKILATSIYYQSKVGHILYYQGLLNAHWVKFHDNLQLSESGKPMVYYLPVDTKIEAVDLPALDPDDIQIGQVVECGDLKERHLGYSYEVVYGADDYDENYIGDTVYGGASVIGENSEDYYIEFENCTSCVESVILAKHTKLKRVEDYHG